MLPIIQIPIAIIVKSFLAFGILIYIVFAVIVLRQVQLMISSLEVPHEGIIRTIAWGHLFFSIGILILVLVIL